MSIRVQCLPIIMIFDASDVDSFIAVLLTIFCLSSFLLL